MRPLSLPYYRIELVDFSFVLAMNNSSIQCRCSVSLLRVLWSSSGGSVYRRWPSAQLGIIDVSATSLLIKTDYNHQWGLQSGSNKHPYGHKQRESSAGPDFTATMEGWFSYANRSDGKRQKIKSCTLHRHVFKPNWRNNSPVLAVEITYDDYKKCPIIITCALETLPTYLIVSSVTLQ